MSKIDKNRKGTKQKKSKIEKENYVKKNNIDLNDENDIEQRRATRLGAVIAIIAIAGSICTITFKLSMNSLNIWGIHDGRYVLAQILVFLSVSTMMLLIFRIICFVINDLKRYNIVDKNYKQYDDKSDNNYNFLIKDFKIYLCMLMVVLIIISNILKMLGTLFDKIIAVLLSVVLSVLLIRCIIYIIKNHKEKIREYLKLILQKIFWWVMTGGLCYYVALIFLMNSNATVNIEYHDNGTIEISAASLEGFGSLEITICDENETAIFTNNIDKTDILFAREDKYMVRNDDGISVDEGIVVESEFIHWKYVFDARDVINEEGKYYMIISVGQDGERAEIINTMILDSNKYTYTKESITKSF